MLRKKTTLFLLITILFLFTAFTAAAEFPVTLTDDFGHEVTIEEEPERIVSMTPSTTEILYALGLEDRIVGVTDFCNYPEAAVEETKIGGTDAGLEPVMAVEPDLVVSTNMNDQETVERLMEMGYPVVAINSLSIDDVYHAIALLGQATGKVAQSGTIINEMKSKYNSLMEKMERVDERPLVFYEVWDDPYMSVNDDTFIGQLIVKAGGENLTGDAQSGYPTVSVETIIDNDPEVYILPTGHGNVKRMTDIENRTGFGDMSAVTNERIYLVDQEIISRPGPRIIEGLETFTRAIHPELFE